MLLPTLAITNESQWATIGSIAARMGYTAEVQAGSGDLKEDIKDAIYREPSPSVGEFLVGRRTASSSHGRNRHFLSTS